MLRVDVICGLLGTGKTTLIRRMLETVYAGQRVAVIENEIGRVNLDGPALKTERVQVREVTGGCVCCSLKQNFCEALKEYADTDTFDRMIVEPSGVADIRDLLAVCEENPAVETGRLIMTVHAGKITRLLTVFGRSFIGQIRTVDTAWLNFTEKLAPEQIAQARQALWEINPLLTIVDVPVKEVTAETFPDRRDDISRLAVREMDDGSDEAPVFLEWNGGPGRISADGGEPGPEGLVFSAGDQTGAGIPKGTVYPKIRRYSPALQGHRIAACSAVLSEPLSKERQEWLIRRLQQADFDRVFRAKGYLEKSGGGILSIDLAGEEVYTKELASFDPSRTRELVIIGYERDAAGLAAEIRKKLNGDA